MLDRESQRFDGPEICLTQPAVELNAKGICGPAPRKYGHGLTAEFHWFISRRLDVKNKGYGASNGLA